MVLDPRVSPYKQIVKDYDVKQCISIEELKIRMFHFFHVISLQFIPHLKWCMQALCPKPHLLAENHIGKAYIVYSIWPLLAFDIHEGHYHPKLARAVFLTKFGSHKNCLSLWLLLTFDVHEGPHHPKLASAALLTKFGSHRALIIIITSVDLWPPRNSSSS